MFNLIHNIDRKKEFYEIEKTKKYINENYTMFNFSKILKHKNLKILK